jgi:hypothetical protein
MCRWLHHRPVRFESGFSSLLFATLMLTLGVERYFPFLFFSKFRGFS